MKISKIIKKLATIAIMVMIAVICAVGVTFVSVQKDKAGGSSLLTRNIEAMATPENDNEKRIESVVTATKEETVTVKQGSKTYTCTALVRTVIDCLGIGNLACVVGATYLEGQPYNCVEVPPIIY